MSVSRETVIIVEPGVSRGTSAFRRGWLFLPLFLCVLAFASACGRPPGPRGWAAPEPVQSKDLTLVPYKTHVYAIPKGSEQPAWQFPPSDRNVYGVSKAAQNELKGMLNDFGLSDSDRNTIESRIDDLTVSGPSAKSLKDAVNATSADRKLRNAFMSRVDAITRDEKKALTSVRALYGNLGLSADGGSVYVPSYGGWLFAVDVSSGKTLWIDDLDPVVGGVTVNGDELYVGTKASKLYALNATNGSVLSQTKLDGDIWGAPVFTQDKQSLLVSTLGGSLYRLTRTFEQQWRFAGADAAIAQKPVVNDDLVYVGSFDNRLYAIDVTTGDERWHIEADNWFWGEPVVAEGTLFAASLDGNVYAVDAKSGDPRWTKPFDTGSKVRSGLALGNGALIVGARNGQVYKLSLADGAPVGSPLRVGTTLEADLTADTDGDVYAISRDPVLFIIETKDSLSADFYRFAQ